MHVGGAQRQLALRQGGAFVTKGPYA
jgi:hypothetical protein